MLVLCGRLISPSTIPSEFTHVVTEARHLSSAKRFPDFFSPPAIQGHQISYRATSVVIPSPGWEAELGSQPSLLLNQRLVFSDVHVVKSSVSYQALVAFANLSHLDRMTLPCNLHVNSQQSTNWVILRNSGTLHWSPGGEEEEAGTRSQARCIEPAASDPWGGWTTGVPALGSPSQWYLYMLSAKPPDLGGSGVWWRKMQQYKLSSCINFIEI